MTSLRMVGRFVARTFTVLLVSVSPVAAQTSPTDVPEIETVGTAERRVAPDRAILHLQIESKAVSAGLAASTNARVVQRVRDTLKVMGLAGETTTASYNVGPNWEHDGPRDRNGPTRTGYVARTVVRVQLTKLNEIGSVIDATLAKGATGIDGVMFESTAAMEARRGALADAAAAARADAEALAKAMGGTLGALISTSTAGSDDPRRANVMMRRMGMGAMGMAAAQTTITPDEIVIGAGVVARWRFVPGR